VHHPTSQRRVSRAASVNFVVLHTIKFAFADREGVIATDGLTGAAGR
jgi:hypothetical protein